MNLYALAVNEENASGGRVVTAPTNGAAGVIPAVMHYYRDFVQVIRCKVCMIFANRRGDWYHYQRNASISGAEVGCQGRSARPGAMAAAGLTHVLGGSPAQCANAAEIGIEHHLGMTCDPIAGWLQVPCIERKCHGSSKGLMPQGLRLKAMDSMWYRLIKPSKP